MSYPVSSVIIARDEENEITGCIESILEADPYEIIVIVDGRTEDNTEKKARVYTDKIYTIKGTRGELRNLGWKKSSQDIVCYIDADMRPQKNYFKEGIKFFKEDNIASVGGALLPLGEALSGYLEWVLWDNSGDFGAGGAFFRRKALKEVKGFNDSLHSGEDADISLRLRNNGWERKLMLSSRIYHRFAQSWQELFHKWVYGGSRWDFKNLLLLLASPVRAPLIAFKYKCWHVLWFYPLRWFVLAFLSGRKGYKPLR